MVLFKTTLFQVKDGKPEIPVQLQVEAHREEPVIIKDKAFGVLPPWTLQDRFH